MKDPGFKLDGSYNKDPCKRRVRAEYVSSSTYRHVDDAVREPVRIMNEVLGMGTIWSCEGHAADWSCNGGILGQKWDGDRVVSKCFQESYIALLPMRIEEAHCILCYLESIDFKPGSTPRKEGDFGYRSIYFNFPGGHLEADARIIEEEGKAVVCLRVGPHNVEMERAPWRQENNEHFRDLGDSLSGLKALGQQEWDRTRDIGWELWLGILLRNVSRQCEKEK